IHREGWKGKSIKRPKVSKETEVMTKPLPYAILSPLGLELTSLLQPKKKDARERLAELLLAIKFLKENNISPAACFTQILRYDFLLLNKELDKARALIDKLLRVYHIVIISGKKF
ncbi:hypothetical protein ACJX0J_020006, partial [Zea mays]